MKKTVTVLIMLTALLFISNGVAQVELGLQAGANFGDVSLDPTPDGTETSMRTGFLIGGVLFYSFTPIVGLQVEPAYAADAVVGQKRRHFHLVFDLGPVAPFALLEDDGLVLDVDSGHGLTGMPVYREFDLHAHRRGRLETGNQEPDLGAGRESPLSGSGPWHHHRTISAAEWSVGTGISHVIRLDKDGPGTAEKADGWLVRLLRSQDVFGLILNLAGLQPQTHQELEHDELFLTESAWRTYRTQRWKSFIRRDDGTQLLVDLRGDPGEQRDVSGQNPSIADAHRKRIATLSQELSARNAPPTEISADDRARLNALGYLE